MKRVEGDRDNNVEHMWEQVKRAIVESAREVCGSVRVGGKNTSEESQSSGHIKHPPNQV